MIKVNKAVIVIILRFRMLLNLNMIKDFTKNTLTLLSFRMLLNLNMIKVSLKIE